MANMFTLPSEEEETKTEVVTRSPEEEVDMMVKGRTTVPDMLWKIERNLSAEELKVLVLDTASWKRVWFIGGIHSCIFAEAFKHCSTHPETIVFLQTTAFDAWSSANFPQWLWQRCARQVRENLAAALHRTGTMAAFLKDRFDLVRRQQHLEQTELNRRKGVARATNDLALQCQHVPFFVADKVIFFDRPLRESDFEVYGLRVVVVDDVAQTRQVLQMKVPPPDFLRVSHYSDDDWLPRGEIIFPRLTLVQLSTTLSEYRAFAEELKKQCPFSVQDEVYVMARAELGGLPRLCVVDPVSKREEPMVYHMRGKGFGKRGESKPWLTMEWLNAKNLPGVLAK